MAKKIYVLDTSVYLTDANAIYAYGHHDIIIPLKVLEEIDGHKKRQDSVGLNARNIIRILDELREKGSLKKGVRIETRKGIVCVKPFILENLKDTQAFSNLSSLDSDNMIIGTALAAQNEHPRRKVIVVSRDINMRIKCDAVGIIAKDFILNQVVENSNQLYTGFVQHLVDDQVIDHFYDGEDIYLEEGVRLYPNQFLMLVSNSNEKKTALARFESHNFPLRKIPEHKDVWGVKTRNKEQHFAMDLLMNSKVPVITLVGKAGSGKTLCAISAGLQQVLGETADKKYDRLIISRPIQPMGKDIGYLPGTMEEKMFPWLAPIQDNLEFLMGGRKSLDMYVDDGTIEIEALTYIRGRSISNAYMIIDEAQQLTRHEIKTILTRVGENTKIVFTGDIEQIDNVYVDETSNGLANAVEKFKKKTK